MLNHSNNHGQSSNLVNFYFPIHFYSKNIEVQTQYNHFYVPGSEKKQQLLTTPSPYQKLDKSVVRKS